MPIADAAVQLQRDPAAGDEPEVVVRVRPGEVIFREGEAARAVFVVVRGQVVLEPGRWRTDRRRSRHVRTRRLHFGELGPFLGFHARNREP